MTHEETIYKIKAKIGLKADCVLESDQERQVVWEALEKQIPKEPHYDDIENIYGKAYKRICSECGDTMILSKEARPLERYCRYCGKRLKGWS